MCKTFNDACGPCRECLRDDDTVTVVLSRASYRLLRDNIPMILDMLWNDQEMPSTVEKIDRYIELMKIMRELVEVFDLGQS